MVTVLLIVRRAPEAECRLELERKYKGNCWPCGPPSGRGACSKGGTFESSISTSNSSYQDPILPVYISQGLSVHQLLGSGSLSPLPWATAAGSLEPMGGDALTEGGGCTCLLGTRSGPVPQVLLANTSGDHSKARGGVGGGGRGNEL